MSKLTRMYFEKLHQKMMQDSDYRSGYQYARNHELWTSINTADLIEDSRNFMISAKKDMDNYLFGCAFALREILWARLARGGVAA